MIMKLSSTSKVLALAAPVSALAIQSADAEIKVFLKYDSIDGESTTTGFEKQIDVVSWSWGASRQSVDEKGQPGVPEFESLTVVRRIDKASPQLMINTLKGQTRTNVTLNMNFIYGKGSSQENEVNFFRMSLDNVYISQVRMGAGLDVVAGGKDGTTGGVRIDPNELLEVVRFDFHKGPYFPKFDIGISAKDPGGAFKDLGSGSQFFKWP
jgi:type VI secretion system Hcp family effector